MATKNYFNCEATILSAVQLKSVGGAWSPRPDANGVKNIEVYDFVKKQRVPFVGDYLSVKFAISRCYKYVNGERQDDGMYGVEVFADIPVNDLYANEKGKYQGIIDSLITEDEATDGDFKFATGFALKTKLLDLTVTDYVKKNGDTMYQFFKCQNLGDNKPPVRLDVSNIKASASTVTAFQKLLEKRGTKPAAPAAKVEEVPATDKPPVVAGSDIPF